MPKYFRLPSSLIALFLAGAVTSSSYAGSGGGKDVWVMAHSGGINDQGVAMFKTETNSNKAGCSTADGGAHWAVSLDKETGRAMFSLLLSVQAQGIKVAVTGANDCAHWSDRERPAYIRIL